MNKAYPLLSAHETTFMRNPAHRSKPKLKWIICRNFSTHLAIIDGSWFCGWFQSQTIRFHNQVLAPAADFVHEHYSVRCERLNPQCRGWERCITERPPLMIASLVRCGFFLFPSSRRRLFCGWFHEHFHMRLASKAVSDATSFYDSNQSVSRGIARLDSDRCSTTSSFVSFFI